MAVLGFCGVLVWRVREGRSPVTARKLIIPPFGMATGFCMFFAPPFRIPILWALGAFLIGATLLAYPLIHTSRLTRDGSTIMMQRSKAFYLVMLVLAIIRFAAKNYIGKFITLEQTGGLFFVLAFGMIVCWRVAMYLEYGKLVREG